MSTLISHLSKAGKAPTFAEFANAWLKANGKGLGVHLDLHPEAAWLTDRARNEAGKDWKLRFNDTDFTLGKNVSEKRKFYLIYTNQFHFFFKRTPPRKKSQRL